MAFAIGLWVGVNGLFGGGWGEFLIPLVFEEIGGVIGWGFVFEGGDFIDHMRVLVRRIDSGWDHVEVDGIWIHEWCWELNNLFMGGKSKALINFQYLI